MKTKRLFLFAGYHPKNIIDDALVHYVKSLSKFGDIVLCMDSDCPDSEINKIKKHTLHSITARHGEYDFGSYKRAYLWACDNLKLSDYDFVYLVNDSVYGPLYPLDRYFDAMENMGHPAFGLVTKKYTTHPHIQSWFIGTKPEIFLSDWFDKFMRQIKKLANKGQITTLYENGFSELIVKHGFTWDCLYSVFNRGVYNKIQKLYMSGMPFMKKVAFTRNHGGLGRQVLYVLNQIDKKTADAILDSAKQQYGEQHVKWFLTKNTIKIAYRNIKHTLCKIFIEGI
ncbi:MAG: hypothetical protein IKZ34_00720 [Alphaproteobacteria bacterium]|jgi:lipopolysaccharide biosynthesis protein|nr:hypothetical protein [Alphaproteobacteria bacterium]